jgi:toluene monooxygenase system protein E
MTKSPANRARPRRTFSAFGDVRRMPSEYELVTQGQNWTLRPNRVSTFEENPASLANLWFLAHRDKSPLTAENWDAFRDPAGLTYRSYVAMQNHSVSRVHGVLETHASISADTALAPQAVFLLATLLTPSRYVCHGCQQVEAYIGLMAPSPYITSAASYSTADYLRRVTTVAYRTRELQVAFPDLGFGTAERQTWETHEAWQPARRAIEYALVSYDWGEAFTALNLVLAPTLDDVLLTQLGQTARTLNDNQTWMLTSFLAEDSARRNAWSRALAELAVAQTPDNRRVLSSWVHRWTGLADDAAMSLGAILESASGAVTATDVVAHARTARQKLLAGVLNAADDHRSVGPG